MAYYIIKCKKNQNLFCLGSNSFYFKNFIKISNRMNIIIKNLIPVTIILVIFGSLIFIYIENIIDAKKLVKNI